MIVEIKSDLMLGRKPDVKLPDGCWGAGGAYRRWFMGEPQNSDIDVFCKNDEAEAAFVEANGLGGIKKDEFVMATNYKVGDRLIQVNKLRFGTIEAVFAWFDYSICQFGIDGDRPVATPEALIGASRKHLAVNNIHKEYAADSLRRAFKYAAAGYSPCLGTIRDIAKAMLQATPEEIEQQVLISPRGGVRDFIRFD